MKQETDEDYTSIYPQKKTFRKLGSRIKKYEGFATVVTIHERFPKNVSPYYDTVFVSAKEIEQIYLMRFNHRYDSVPYKCEKCKIGYNMRLDYLRHQTFNHCEVGIMFFDIK